MHLSFTWAKAFKNGPSKICGRQPLKTTFSFKNSRFKIQNFSEIAHCQVK